jgi:tripartite-type tricarboxylate transporter receptor subunit TctC
MHMTRRYAFRAGNAALAALAAPVVGLRPMTAHAAWPERPVRVVVPYAPGGNLDTLMRIVAPVMSRHLGQPIVIENRAGAAGAIGTELVARAAADGYTLIVGSNASMVINPIILPRMPYDPVRDFAPIALGFRTPNVLVISRRLPVTTLREFIEYAKARPGQVSCASPGSGSSNHLLIELFSQTTGAGLVHVPYRSSSGAAPDMIAGNLACSMDQITTALPLHRDNQVRIVGIAMPQRTPLLPDVPTMGEVGLPDGGLVAFIGLYAPAGTPADAIGRIRDALAAALEDAPTRDRIEGLGSVVATGADVTPEGLAALMRRETELSRRAARAAGLLQGG